MTKLQNNKGFTLVELLIVIAIIAILAAVALPVYSAQMETARESVDQGTVRSAASLAQSDYLLSGVTHAVEYQIVVTKVGDTNNVAVEAVLDGNGDPAEASTTGPTASHTWEPVSKEYQTEKAEDNLFLVVANGGEIVASSYDSNTWLIANF